MHKFRANQGRFGQNKARLGQSKCGFANLQTRINTGGEGPTIPKSKFYFTIPVTIEMVLYRSMQIEDLKKIYLYS
jgi:hypothetical protein